MRLSTRGRYGLRIMMELALRHGSGPVMVESIASAQGLTPSYVHLLAGGLKQAGLIKSVRGPGGGHELAKDPSKISALDIFEALEGPAFIACVEDPGACTKTRVCATRDLWHDAWVAMEKILADRTLADLVEAQRTKGTEHPLCDAQV